MCAKSYMTVVHHMHCQSFTHVWSDSYSNKHFLSVFFFNLLALDSAQSDLFDVKAKFDEVTAARCVL